MMNRWIVTSIERTMIGRGTDDEQEMLKIHAVPMPDGSVAVSGPPEDAMEVGLYFYCDTPLPGETVIVATGGSLNLTTPDSGA